MTEPWVDDGNAALLVDQYELTMLQAYWREEMFGEAVFSLFSRRLPRPRNYLLACGLEDALHYLERLHFDQEALDYLSTLPELSGEFLDWLGDLRFTGDVYAVPEGTPVFANEPLIEIEAPLPEGQVVETFLMNQLNTQTLVASKASRVVTAANGRSVVDFGLRRAHGADAGLKGARAYHIAGLDGTSNVLAGKIWGVPVTGTMAHSYIQAHDDEIEAFRAFLELYPETVLVVDTYDSLSAVAKIVRLARELGDDFKLRAIRLDSGDLAELAREARRMLDEGGLGAVRIFASGGLDEYQVAGLVAEGAPIDGFGVGTALAVSQDAPALDFAYKLTAYDGVGRIKVAPGKPVLPGRKQVYRVEDGHYARHDIVALADERIDGRPLLRKVMEGGKRLEAGREPLDAARRRARAEIDRLLPGIRALEPADPPYPVHVSDRLQRWQQELIDEIENPRPASRA